MKEYIDRQSVLDDLTNLWDWDSVDGIQTSTALKQVITDVKNVPAADVREIARGRWTERSPFLDIYIYKCSLCKRSASEAFNFCPHCGAEMRKV